MNLPWRQRPKSHRTRLGELLIKHGAEQSAVDAAMTEYYDRGRCGEYCLERGACTREQLELALSEQAAERGDFEEAGRIVMSAIESTRQTVRDHLSDIRAQISTLLPH